jgi:tetratricopeptide (TPR) repeat protein
MSEEIATAVSRRRKKRRLPKFAYKSRFFLLLIRDRKFRIAVGGALALIVVLSAILPRIWITCPLDCPTVARVSLIDLAEVPFLRRQAARAAERGDYPLALQKWGEALANSPCDLKANQGYFDALAAQPKPSIQWYNDGSRQTQFYMSATRSNANDVARVAGFFGAYGLYDQVFQWLPLNDANLTPLGAWRQAEALFESRQMEKFGRVWARNESALAANGIAALYHQAWLAGWGPADQGRVARQQLEQAATNPPTHLQALRLLLAVDVNNADLASYQSHLNRLADKHEERGRDRYEWWMLLDLCGKRTTAVQDVAKYTVAPATADDALMMVEVFRRLKLYDRVSQFAHEDLKLFADNPELWRAAAEAIMESDKWDDVRLFAAEIREQYGLKKSLAGYIPYMEGVAAYHQLHRPAALDSFAEAVTNLPSDRTLAFMMSAGMRQLGCDDPADRILDSIKGKDQELSAFLKGLHRSAWDARRDRVALAIARELYRINSKDPDNARLFSSALLAARKNPEDAVKITSELLGQTPGDPVAILNHADALVQNRRLAEAEEALRRLDNQSLGDRDRTVAQMARLELDLLQGRTQEAVAGLGRVEQRFLFPVEQEWISRQRYALRPKTVRRS